MEPCAAVTPKKDDSLKKAACPPRNRFLSLFSTAACLAVLTVVCKFSKKWERNKSKHGSNVLATQRREGGA